MASKKDSLASRRSSETGGKGKSLSKSSVQKVMSAAQSARDKGVKDASFSDLAKLEKQTQVKYDRGADLDKYINKLDLYNKGIMAGATPDPETGRLNFVNRGVKDEQGRTILSMNQPYITAMPPTGKQLMGDIGRSLFSGYNTLSYDPNAVGTPSTTGGTISRVPGLVPNLINKAMEGKVGIIGGVRGLWDKVRGFFNPSQTPQGIETQFPRVSPEDRGYFGGYNQGIDTQIPVANDRGMNIPVSIAQPVASTPLNTGFIPEGYGGITSIPLSSGYLPEGYSYGIGSVPDYYDSNNTLGNIYLNSQGYNVPVSNNLMSSRTPSYLEQQDNYYYQNRPQSSPTGQQYYYADASKKDIKTIAPFRDAGMSYGDVMNNFGSVIDNLRQKNPSLTDDDIKGILDGTITKPTGIFAKNGGSVDKYAGLGYKLR